jgi:hypothetical protein
MPDEVSNIVGVCKLDRGVASVLASISEPLPSTGSLSRASYRLSSVYESLIIVGTWS